MHKWLLFFLPFFLFLLLIGCSTEVKTLEVRQELEQIQRIGNDIGSMPYNFSVTDTKGNEIILSKISGPVVVYFLATWCPYCAQDFTELSKVYPKYEDKVEFIAISMDLSENNEKLKNYKSKYPMLKSVYFAQGKEQILKDYSVIRTTTKYAIKNGTIIYSGSGVFSEKNWDLLLGELAK